MDWCSKLVQIKSKCHINWSRAAIILLIIVQNAQASRNIPLQFFRSLSSAQSTPQELPTGRSLYFRTVPRDTVVNAGQRVQLECSADGYPQPQLSWQKDGGGDFPAARERRMLVSESGNTFYITEASISDIGIYSCIAKNEVQTILTNASLLVYQAANFSSPMPASVEFTAGTTAVVKCPASGYPRPSIVWAKDDKPIKITERHFMTADDQLLIIVKSRFIDAGEYSCEIRNDLAAEFGSTRLNIVSRSHSSYDPLAEPLINSRTLSYLLLFCVFTFIVFIAFMLYTYFAKGYFDSRRSHKEQDNDDFDGTTVHHSEKKRKAELDHHHHDNSTNEAAASFDLLASSRGVTCVASSTCSDTASMHHQLTVDLYKDDTNPYGTVV